MKRSMRTLLVAGASTSMLVACSLLTDLGGYADGEGGGAPDASRPDVELVARADGSSCACLDVPPAGWQGPAGFTTGTGAAPPCSGEYAADVLQAFADPDAPPATCTCTCDTAGVTCPSNFSVNVFNSNACTGTRCDSVALSPGACVYVQNTCTFANGIGPVPPPQGTCTPKATTSPAPKWSWKTATRACELPGIPQQEGCGTGRLCAPLPGPSMNLRPCIFKAGDVACPSGPYSVKRVFFADGTDTRTCGECGCGAPTGTCSASIREGCTTAPGKPLTACTATNDPLNIQLLAAPTPTNIACAPSGGGPTGGVTPTGPTTVCCLP